MRREKTWANLLLILVFTLLGFAVMGYHPGLEDDAIYLAAVKSDLNPALFPHDAAFFRLQLQATVFDNWMADFIRLTHVPVAWAELIWQLAAIFMVLWACHRIARRLFAEVRSQWGAVAMVSAMFTLPVAGTALYLMDQHLHPRNLATALILAAVAALLEGKRWQAPPLLAIAFLLHPIMAVMGISFAVFLWAALSEAVPVRLRALRSWGSSAAAAALPLGWIFEPPNPIWRKALATRAYDYLNRWTWYEWLGALAPLALFWLLWRVARGRGNTRLAQFALAVFAYGIFQQAVAAVMLSNPGLIRLAPLQPMRYLQLVYLFMALAAGGVAAKFLLKTSLWRWTLFLAAANAGMCACQCAQFKATRHLELPWSSASAANPWLQAFAWIRHNTPTGAYFALDPDYMALPGEDFHGFRALAERSQLADAVKDTAAVTQVPGLSAEWYREVEAEQGWPAFQLGDFERLKSEFGVDWVLVRYPQPPRLDCRWHNAEVAACQIP